MIEESEHEGCIDKTSKSQQVEPTLHQSTTVHHACIIDFNWIIIATCFLLINLETFMQSRWWYNLCS